MHKHAAPTSAEFCSFPGSKGGAKGVGGVSQGPDSLLIASGGAHAPASAFWSAGWD